MLEQLEPTTSEGHRVKSNKDKLTAFVRPKQMQKLMFKRHSHFQPHGNKYYLRIYVTKMVKIFKFISKYENHY